MEVGFEVRVVETVVLHQCGGNVFLRYGQVKHVGCRGLVNLTNKLNNKHNNQVHVHVI